MPDTQSTNLLLTIQTVGGNSNTWGVLANANFEEIDDKLGDVTSISTSGGNTNLTTSQEIVNAIVVSGSLSSNAVINFSGRGGTWVVENDTTGDYSLTCKVTGQTGVTVAQGSAAVVYCNGTDIALGNPAATASAEVTVASATTTALLSAGSDFVAISGTATITSFGTGANKVRYVRATGAFLITHNATTLICPGGRDIRAISGDTFIVISDASSNCRIYAYQRASFVPPSVPVGTVFDYAGSAAPDLWIFCYGQAISRTTYAALFAAIGTTYGVGDATTTFNLPDLRGRVVAGRDNMGNASADRLTNQTGGVEGDILGSVGGTERHTITAAESAVLTYTSTVTDPGHTHNYDRANQAGTNAGGGGSISQLGSYTSTASASATTGITVATTANAQGLPHNNVQPTIILNKIIFAGV